MEKKIARIGSFLLHPLLMPSLGLLFIFNSGTYMSFMAFQVKKLIFLIVAAGTLLIPLAFIPLLMYQRAAFDIRMTGKKERMIPLFITTVLYGFCYLLIRRVPIPASVHAFVLGCAFSVALVSVISVKWKISAHMAGAGGVTGLLLYLSFVHHVNLLLYLILAVVISGVAGYSRLRLEEHDEAQVYVGYLTGLATVGVSMLVY